MIYKKLSAALAVAFMSAATSLQMLVSPCLCRLITRGRATSPQVLQALRGQIISLLLFLPDSIMVL